MCKIRRGRTGGRRAGKEPELKTDRGRYTRTQREESCVLNGTFGDNSDETETCTAPVLCDVCGLFWPDVRVSDLMSGLVEASLGAKLMWRTTHKSCAVSSNSE